MIFKSKDILRERDISKLKNSKGITLIVLIITIVILLILAGVVIVTLSEVGLLKKTEESKNKMEYFSAKEIITLKLMEIQLNCESEKKEISIEEIALEMKKANNISIEKYYNSEIATIRDGLTENLINLNGIVVSANEYSKHKFLLGKDCKIIGVLEKEITENTSVNEFIKLEDYENNIVKNENDDINDIAKFQILNSANENGWYNADVKIIISENKKQKLNKIIYRINNGQEYEIQNNKLELEISNEGENIFAYYVVDYNGNRSEEVTKIIKIDKSKPQNIKINKGNVEANKAIIEITADDKISGVQKYEVYVNGNKYNEVTENKCEIIGLKPNEEYKIYVKAFDNAGNMSEDSEIIVINTKNAYVYGDLIFESFYGYSNVPYTKDISKMAYLFDENINNSGYGAVMLDNYEDTYVVFSTEKALTIEAYGDSYSDSAGNSNNKRVKFSKYNEEKGEYEPYKIIYTKLREWYELVDLEPGKYKMQSYDVYVRFDEWRIKEN